MGTERLRGALLSALMIVALMVPAISLLFVSNTSALSPVSVLIDYGHREYMSNYTLMIQYVEDMGYEVGTTSQPLTPELLDQFDILIVVLPFENFAVAEQQAVYDFVNAGGSLLTASAWGFMWQANESLNSLTTQFGVTYSLELALGSTSWLYSYKCTLSTHPIATGVPFIYSEGPQLDVQDPAQAIAWTDYDNVVLAVGEYGQGRCIFASAIVPLNDFIPTTEGEQFIWNAFKWLAHEDSGVGAAPTVHRDSMILRPGPSLSSEELENFHVLKGMIHIHTTFSDGDKSPENRVEELLTRDVDFAAITDHNQVEGSLVARDYALNEGKDIIIIPGIEATTSIGHVLALNVTSNLSTSDAAGAVNEIHNMGGLAILAHPFWYGIDAGESVGIDGYEIINGGLSHPAWPSLGVDNYFVGGCDAHTTEQLDSVINYVFVEEESTEGIMHAIEERRIVAYSQAGYFTGDAIWINALRTAFKLENLYAVSLDANLYLENGSKLVVKFYTYADSYQGENVVWSGTAPDHVSFTKTVPHPEHWPVEKARLDLTDNNENVISTIATFTVTRSVLWNEFIIIYMEWPFASLERRNDLMAEIAAKYLQWPFAPF